MLRCGAQEKWSRRSHSRSADEESRFGPHCPMEIQGRHPDRRYRGQFTGSIYERFTRGVSSVLASLCRRVDSRALPRPQPPLVPLWFRWSQSSVSLRVEPCSTRSWRLEEGGTTEIMRAERPINLIDILISGNMILPLNQCARYIIDGWADHLGRSLSTLQ